MRTYRKYMTLALIMLIALTAKATSGGEGHPLTEGSETTGCTLSFSVIDSILTTKVGKETADIVLHADSVIGEAIPWNGQTLASKLLPEWMSKLAKYTLCMPDMYRSDRKVYTRFEPHAILTFHHGDHTVTLQLDYGIGKWVLLDDEGQMVVHHDMPSQQLLPMLLMLFPDCELLKLKYDEYLQEKK